MGAQDKVNCRDSARRYIRTERWIQTLYYPAQSCICLLRGRKGVIVAWSRSQVASSFPNGRAETATVSFYMRTCNASLSYKKNNRWLACLEKAPLLHTDNHWNVPSTRRQEADPVKHFNESPLICIIKQKYMKNVNILAESLQCEYKNVSRGLWHFICLSFTVCMKTKVFILSQVGVHKKLYEILYTTLFVHAVGSSYKCTVKKKSYLHPQMAHS